MLLPFAQRVTTRTRRIGDSPYTVAMDETVIDTRVQLEVWSDVACPWCYVGRRNLGVALADIEEHERPAVTWRAFQLDPTIPAEGVDADAYFAQRFGADLPRLEESRERLVAMGEELGIQFRFDRQRVVPNTHLAHRVLAAADLHDEREPLLDALFEAYFERGIDIGDVDALRELVAEQLADEQLAARIMELAITDPTRTARVDEDIAMARALAITGVPCFVADRKIAVPGAVPPPVLAQLLAEARERVDAGDED
jgi:predicted DsbA family dithiol-disulfide isomerase